MRCVIKSLGGIVALLIGLCPALALAATVQLCEGQSVMSDATGRVFGHMAYGEAVPVDLVEGPRGFSMRQECRMHRSVVPDLERMLRAIAATPGLEGEAYGISCFRSIAHQRQVFCSKLGPGRVFATAADRARYAAPPGFSEHATGYTIDFGVRPSPNCSDVNPCIAALPLGRWLLAHAQEYGFELSFPAANTQGVSWEPWHWRWVGSSIDAPGAIAARAIFAPARALYPGRPGIADSGDHWIPAIKPAPPKPTTAPWPPVYVQPLPPRGLRRN